MNVKLKRHLFLKRPQTTDIGPHTNLWSWNGHFPFHFLFGKIMTDMCLGAQEGDGHVGLGSVCAFGNCLTFFPNMETCSRVWNAMEGTFSEESPEKAGCLIFVFDQQLVYGPCSSRYHSRVAALLCFWPCACPSALSPGYRSHWHTRPPFSPTDDECATRLILSFHPWWWAESVHMELSCDFLRFLELILKILLKIANILKFRYRKRMGIRSLGLSSLPETLH